MNKLFYAIMAISFLNLATASPVGPMMTLDHNKTITPYVASDLSLGQIDTIWDSMRNNHFEKSVCADRAMVWSYELKRYQNVNSMKTFIHFTNIFKHVVDNNGEHIKLGAVGRFFRRYISTKPVIWHYHVAPSVYSDGNIMVLDRMYADTPWTLDQWENRFIRKAIEILNDSRKREDLIANLRQNIEQEQNSSSNKARLQLDQSTLRLIRSSYNKASGKYEPKCKKITNIIEHDLHNYDAWCHLQQTSPFYWNPQELRMLNYNSTYVIMTPNLYDLEDQEKGAKNIQTGFAQDKVESSYKDAFGENF